ncbi:MAG: hypothetical protein NTY90_00335 [Candidatus Micrarchaeota archaeon]|nr:hypothetical protein [Candidatus Micrarchaeota archaeon]
MAEARKFILLAAVVFASLLASGCVSQTPSPEATPAGGATVSPSATPVAQATNLPSIVGKGYSELIAMGASLECDLTVTTESGKISGKAFFKSGNLRIDGTASASGTAVPLVQIFKSGAVYSSVPAGLEGVLGGMECDWLRFDPAKMRQQTQAVETKTVETTTLDDKTKTAFECREAAVGDDKFATSSECDMTEVINKVLGPVSGLPTLPAG